MNHPSLRLRTTSNLLTLCLLVLTSCAPSTVNRLAPDQAKEQQDQFISKVKQLTFAGARSGEGYFSPDGSKMIFQSERFPGNPFFQMYLMDLKNGATELLSTGGGKTTCGWIHPGEKKVLFSSTHLDPYVARKTREEFSKRKRGSRRSYSWDFDSDYDIFQRGLTDTRKIKRLTSAIGYDAEASYSPDGKWIVFASNRHAYSDSAFEGFRDKRVERDPSQYVDIYLMRSDGSKVKRLTKSPGYDGGPFFSPDGKRIVWRRFAEDGHTAEIFTMKRDGSDQQQITRLGVMSWAPFYHPSGRYIIFANNALGHKNFELFLVDTNGGSEPVQVTYQDGFDGLPVFMPDGRRIAWTTKRTITKSSQIFLGEWNHRAALKALGLKPRKKDRQYFRAKPGSIRETTTNRRLRSTIKYLSADELEGRLTGTDGERLATAFAAKQLGAFGLEPAGDNGTFFQEFPFVAGIGIGDNNELRIRFGDEVERTKFKVDKHWRPVAFSKTGNFERAPIVFAGYGIVAPAENGHEEYDSYVHLDVKDKWVLVLRFAPRKVVPKRRKQFKRYMDLRQKAQIAKSLGARGIIFATGPNSKVNDQLPNLQFDSLGGSSSIAAFGVSTSLAKRLMKHAEKDLKKLQNKLDSGSPVMGFEIPDLTIGTFIDVIQTQKTGRNVLARLRTGESNESVIALGGHIDHLGRGTHGSLATKEERGQIHGGADDNASGVAAVLETARRLAREVQSGKLRGKRDLLVTLWSAEELGTIGSTYFTKSLVNGNGSEPPRKTLLPDIAAYLNLDMVGRLAEKLSVQGLGSSPNWLNYLEFGSSIPGLNINPQVDAYLPTDSTPFYINGVPIMGFFTGIHKDYHSPRDTLAKVNLGGLELITEFVTRVTRGLISTDNPPEYMKVDAPSHFVKRGRLRAYLGTIPDYSDTDQLGVRLSGVTAESPAANAGLEKGDLVIKLAGKKVDNIYDYTFAIESLQIGVSAKITVLRGADEELTFEIIPSSRD